MTNSDTHLSDSEFRKEELKTVKSRRRLYTSTFIIVREPVSPLKPKTLGSQIKTSPVKSTFYGTFSIYPVDNRKTFKCPLQTKFRYKIVTGKSGKSSVTIFDVSP